MAIISLNINRKNVQQDSLRSNNEFDMVRRTEIKKPEFVDSGSKKETENSVVESQKDGLLTASILAGSPNFYNNNGNAMEFYGYFIIPRLVTSDPRYQGAPLKYKHVLFTIFQYAAYANTTHAIGHKIIKINIGQLCVSERGMLQLCNEGVKFQDDLVDKNIVHRAIRFWKKCNFVNHEVIHKKNMITITIPEFYERNKNTSEPESELKVNHKRTSKEEYKELKELKNISFSVADAPSEEKKKIAPFSKKRKKTEPVPLIERDHGIFISDIAHKKLIEEKGSEEIVNKIYSAMAVWKAESGITGGDDYRTALRWSLTPAKPTRPSSVKPQPKYNHDSSPSDPRKLISFAEEV